MSAPAAPATAVRRARVRVEGTVQGVGFRPYVYRLATELTLAGWVINDTRGVLLEIQGERAAIERFLERLAEEAPPLAAVERVAAEDRPAHRSDATHAFEIRASPQVLEHASDATAIRPAPPITPDTATCVDCLRELFTSADRRYRYPFINCTNCGPRFTIVRGVPYDRPLTTMAGFRMCEQCLAEYEDPADRRFHAQPNACPACGPSLSLHLPSGEAAPLDGDAVQTAALALREGQIVAVKGIGGYHLACRADDEPTVARLRSRKHREDKPFALMLADVEAAESVAHLEEATRAVLRGAERPIVLAPRRRAGMETIARSVAPGAPELGVMLAYSPLHHLLLADLTRGGAELIPLVLTSGNRSDEPIAFRDDDALRRLGAIADLLLVHDRPIQTRTDDSVVRVVHAPTGPRATMLRRSRGYVPGAVELPIECSRAILACGAELKNTFCLARENRAWLSHHIGDLENYETLRSFTDGIAHLEALLAVRPEVIVHDLHPEYLSTKYALERDADQLMGVQHHHAHLAAVLAEHGERGPAVGAIFDGTGYGLDGTVWGGELLYGDTADFRRLGALTPVRLPGGARAITEPWRMACAWLTALGCSEIPPGLAGTVDDRAWEQVGRLARSGVSSPVTTSMGRLFDAVAALCGVRARVRYEGQAAIELEAACDPHERGSYAIDVVQRAGTIAIDPRLAIEALLADLGTGVPVGVIASRFHAAVAAATVQALTASASATGCGTAVLAGGVFQNRRLLESALAGLRTSGLRVLVPERLPLGDGAISFGQAVVATRRTSGGDPR